MHIRWLEQAPRFHLSEERGQAISWQAIPWIYKTTLMKVLVGIRALKGKYHQISLSDIYNPKEDKDSTYYQWFPEAKWIVRRPYPIPEISTTLQKLQSFTYAPALDLNIG